MNSKILSMKKNLITSLLVCVLGIFLSPARMYSATYYARAYAEVATEGGSVAVNNSLYDKTGSAIDKQFVAFWNSSADISFQLKSKPETNYYCAGWSTTKGKTDYSTSSSCTITVTATSKDKNSPTLSPVYYALFKKKIEVNPTSVNLILDSKGNSEKGNVSINVYKSATLTAELIGDEASSFTLYNGTTSSGQKIEFATKTDGTTNVELSVAYTGEDKTSSAYDKTVQIRLTNAEGVQEKIDVSVSRPMQITFRASQYGSYVAKNRNTTIATMKEGMADVTYEITNASQGTINLLASPIEGYMLEGWYGVSEDNVEKLLSNLSSYTYQPTQTETLIAKFTKQVAQFQVVGLDNIYNDLNDAVTAAQSNNKTIIAVVADGSIPAGNYTIPAGISLLVPRTDASYELKDSPSENFVKTTPTIFRRLKLEEGTIITVAGKICVDAEILLTTGPLTSAPNGPCGLIEMEVGSSIILQNGASLYAWGFITGKGNVKALQGSSVYEDFQVNDWRGGSASSSMVHGFNKNKENVFPFNQYCIQNIEAPLTVCYGAEHFAVFAVTASLVGATRCKAHIIGESGALFCLTKDNASVTKKYDVDKDRQIYEIEGDLEMRSIEVDVGISVNSKEYVLPITNNMSVSIKSGTTTIYYSLALLADAKLEISESAILKIADSNSDSKATSPTIYIYDKVSWFANKYARTSNFAQVAYIPSRANGKPVARTESTMDDAVVLVNGQVVCDNALYTTGNGAKIISEGRGQVICNYIGSEQNTYQVTQSNTDITWVTIPITSAKLRNADATYEETSIGGKGTYDYYPVDKKWAKVPARVSGAVSELPMSEKVTFPSENKLLSVTLSIVNPTSTPDDDFIADIQGTGFSFAKGTFANSAEYNDDKTQMTILVSYAAQNKSQDVHNGILSLKNKKLPETQELFYAVYFIIQEDYQPDFSANNTLASSSNTSVTCTMSAFVNHTVTTSEQFALAPVSNNVTSLLNRNGMVWSVAVEGDNSFTFHWGEGDEYLSGAYISFAPSIKGTHSATLTITATYTDADGIAKSQSMAVNLIGTASELSNNTLSFVEPSGVVYVNSRNKVAFTGANNAQPISLVIQGADGDGKTLKNGETVIAQITGEGTAESPYMLQTFATTGQITLLASQVEDIDSKVAETTISLPVSIKLNTLQPDWKWGKLYGNHADVAGMPFDASTLGNAASYTLAKSVDAARLLDYDAETHSLTTIRNINSGSATATFHLTLPATEDYEGVEQDFTATIYPDPCILPLLIDNADKFHIVATEKGDGVACSEEGAITIPVGQSVTIGFIGIPDKLTATITGDVIIEEGRKNKDGQMVWTTIPLDNAGIYQFSDVYTITCVRIINNGSSVVSLNSVQISERNLEKTTHYGKILASVVASGAGYVSISSSDNSEPDYSAKQENVWGYSSDEKPLPPSTLYFYLYAKSNPGYYFSGWEAIGESMATEISNLNVPFLRVGCLAENLQVGYKFATYGSMVCETYGQELCDNEDQSAEAQQLLYQEAYKLIPFTHIGTWQANFALAEVTDATDMDFGTVTSPNAADRIYRDVVFLVKGDDAEDFIAEVSGEGFSLDEYSPISSPASEKVMVRVWYTPQNKNGLHQGAVTLSPVAIDDVETTSSATASLQVTEQLTPDFALEQVMFGEGNLGQETQKIVMPTKNTKVTRAASVRWSAVLKNADATDYTGTQYTVICNPATGECTVTYFRETEGTAEADLYITATYTDANNVSLSATQHCSLKGSSTGTKSDCGLSLRSDITIFVDDDYCNPFEFYNSKAGTVTISVKKAGSEDEVGDFALQGDKLYKADGVIYFPVGEYVLTATQEENRQFYGTSSSTTLKVVKHPVQVTWNWKYLYFGSTNTNPIQSNSDGDWTLTKQSGDENVVTYDNATSTAIIANFTEGEYTAKFDFQQQETDIFEKYSNTFVSTIFADPRHLRVDVNHPRVFDVVTVSKGSSVSFNETDQSVVFDAAGKNDDRNWRMYFIGVPDRLYFTPRGKGKWVIDEYLSNEPGSYSTTYAAATIDENQPFSFALQASTRSVAITYIPDAEASQGVLSSFYITPLSDVSTDVNHVYLPIFDDVSKVQKKTVNFTYTHQGLLQLALAKTDADFVIEPAELPALAEDVAYAKQSVDITYKGRTPQEMVLYVKDAKGNTLPQNLTLHTFTYPQSLPIRLTAGDEHSFYYDLDQNIDAVRAAEWNVGEGVITFKNAAMIGSTVQRWVTFTFRDQPSLLRFRPSNSTGTWWIQESSGQNVLAQVGKDGIVTFPLQSSTRTVRIIYESQDAEKVTISDMEILGFEGVTTDPASLLFTDTDSKKSLSITAVNIEKLVLQSDNADFTISDKENGTYASSLDVDVPVSGGSNMGNVTVWVRWNAGKAIANGSLSIAQADESGQTNTIFSVVEMVGTRSQITQDNAKTGIYTGVAEGYTLAGSFFSNEKYKYDRHEVDLTHAFTADARPLFDYIIIYGETSTTDGGKTIKSPTSLAGSNALTPCYLYKKSDDGKAYIYSSMVDNANSMNKTISGAFVNLSSETSASVYITGFCPYASTGYTKEDEGVWFFQGDEDANLDIYLEDCHLYSRYKTFDGHAFIDRQNGEGFSEEYVRGSGAVLVFECTTQSNVGKPFNVTIHTRGSNLLKSHYGCFMESFAGRAFQVSSPVQVHLKNGYYATASATTITFDDKWPTAVDASAFERTNGFLSLQKQVNNAPSIDLGNPNTVINFRGGQVELQNAATVSDNYKTTLAISYRSGKMGGFQMAYGLGTDEAQGGTVNFYDGTTTVIPMKVEERFRQYYLMDKDENGSETDITSCLRCPKKTFVYGGSHCFMRACQDVTSKGGAPSDGNKKLGQLVYTLQTEGKNVDQVNETTKLVTLHSTHFPNDKTSAQGSLTDYYSGNANYENGTYGLQSVTADDKNQLYFWIPEGYDESVKPEEDKKMSYWRACMTRIEAQYGPYGGSVGGDLTIQDEEVQNLLYCQIDEHIWDIISAHKPEKNDKGEYVYTYAAPVKVPASSEYMRLSPSKVGTNPELPDAELQNYVTNKEPFEIANHIYYITSAVNADVWMTFSAPFDVERIYVMETYNEKDLKAIQGTENQSKRDAVLLEQAKHNADFAAFFGVVMALGSNQPFDAIYNDYINWAKTEDAGKYSGDYALRGKHPLTPYNGSNFFSADFFLYESADTWRLAKSQVNTDEDSLIVEWHIPQQQNGLLMQKGYTYSMLFPYCMGCWSRNENGDIQGREYWDYWSGKFLIFEGKAGKQTIQGADAQQTNIADVPTVGLRVTGNASFSELTTSSDKVWEFAASPTAETFGRASDETTTIEPATAYLLGDVPNTASGARAVKINMQTGKVIYGKGGITTDDNTHRTPTVSGGADMFITTTAEGIRIAVRTPQHVRVYSSDGALVFDGHVETLVDVTLLSAGIYVIRGEQEVQKIMVH